MCYLFVFILLLRLLLPAAQAQAQAKECTKTKANPTNAGQCRTISTTAVIVAERNTSRCALMIVNTSVNPMMCRDSTDGVPTAAAGQPIPAGQSLALDWEGRQQWQCIRSAAADAQACVLEGLP